MGVHQLDVPGEALVQGGKIGFRDGSHWRNSYIIIDGRKKTERRGRSTRREGIESREQREACKSWKTAKEHFWRSTSINSYLGLAQAAGHLFAVFA